MNTIIVLKNSLGKIHPKYNTPVNAVIVCGALSTFSCLLGKGALSWFVNASSFGVVIMYSMVALSFIFLRIRQPELPRPYRVKYPKFIGTMAVLVAIFFAYLYLPWGPSPLIAIEWIFVGGWFVVGIALAVWAKIRYSDVTPQEREILLFGEEYANKVVVVPSDDDDSNGFSRNPNPTTN